MKRIIIGIMILGLGGVVAYKEFGKPETYIAPEVITNTVIEEVKVDPVLPLIEEAIKASSTAIQSAAQEAFDATVKQMENKIELEVRLKQKELDDEIIIELEKEIGVY
jgi:hypothetical protein